MKTFLLVVVLVLASTSAKAQTFNPLLARALQDTLDHYVAALTNIKGMSASVSLPGHGVWTGTGGVSYADNPIRPTMLFGIASNTKLFVAATILKLAESKALSLDDPIGRWIGTYRNIDPAITIRQLLQHTSGISDPLFVAPWMDTIRNNPTRVFTPEEVMGWVGAPLFVRGKGWGYSNMNYVIAGLIAEKATSKHISVLIRELILTPLGLSNTFFDVKESSPGPIAHRWYNSVDMHDSSRVGLNTAGASAGALFATSSDMVRWYSGVLGGGLLDSASYRELTSFVATGGPPYTYGLGIENQSFFGHVVWGHGGSTWGYRSRMVYDPCMGAAVCGLSNSWPSGVEGVTLLLYNVLATLLPACASPVEGASTVCQGQGPITYRTPRIAGATSYAWILPEGMQGTSTADSITVQVANNAVSGRIVVQGVNAYGEGGEAALEITVVPRPITPVITFDGAVLRSNSVIGNQWYSSKGAIPSATAQTYTPTVEDTYFVIVTERGCTSDTSNTLRVTFTGVPSDESDRAFVLYPNPARGILRFSSTLDHCELINIYGQTIIQQNEPGLSLSTDGLPRGVYYLRSGRIVRMVIIEN